jgi:hypothetical protein
MHTLWSKSHQHFNFHTGWTVTCEVHVVSSSLANEILKFFLPMNIFLFWAIRRLSLSLSLSLSLLHKQDLTELVHLRMVLIAFRQLPRMVVRFRVAIILMVGQGGTVCRNI